MTPPTPAPRILRIKKYGEHRDNCVPPPPNSYAEVLILNVTVFGDGTFGR